MHNSYIEVDLAAGRTHHESVGDSRDKSLKERIAEVLEGVLEVLDELINPEPPLVPVKIRRPQPPPRRSR